MDTRRPTNPAAEEILGGYFPVLDHGFVALVDYMGTDDSVERAARVSYGYGTRARSQTRGLIRYLRRHLHTTPSEMVEFKFHCAMPMFVARQWVRHRTACLAGNAEAWFDLPAGVKSGSPRLYKLSLADIWERFQPTRNRTRPDKQLDPHYRRGRVRAMHLRHLDEQRGEIAHTRIVDVFRNGASPAFRMTLADGKSIECTAEHRFLFGDGWKTLRDATGLEERNGTAVWRTGESFVQVNGSELQVPALDREDGRRTVTRPRLVRIDGFEYVGVKDTFDLEVDGPSHNYVANGIITHNSVNEYSARYSLLPLLFYTPDPEHFSLQSADNKQGRREAAAAEELRAEAVRRWEEIRREAGDAYGWLIENDVARELARIDLPVSTYTQWYWKIDLHNLLHFLTLRVDPHAQYEIRAFAEVIAGMVKRVAPLSYEAWVDYGLSAAPLSRAERAALARLVEADEEGALAARDGARLSAEDLKELGLSARERRELAAKLVEPPRRDFELDLSRMRDAAEIEEEMRRAVPAVDLPD